ncbi:MAG: PIN domain-containing protein [Actinomycetales bacterium]|nr:PIN domain-containing protein [Actinomycetales bacterium]
MAIVIDASAMIALLAGERGSAVVQEAMDAEPVMSAAQVGELAGFYAGSLVEWSVVSALLDAWGVRIEPVTRQDAQRAGLMLDRSTGLSLGDRLCLALAERLDAQVITADRAWGRAGRVRQIR